MSDELRKAAVESMEAYMDRIMYKAMFENVRVGKGEKDKMTEDCDIHEDEICTCSFMEQGRKTEDILRTWQLFPDKPVGMLTEPAHWEKGPMTGVTGVDLALPGSEQTLIEIRVNADVSEPVVNVDSTLTVLVAHMMNVHPDRLESLPVDMGGPVLARWRVKPEPDEVVKGLTVKA